MRFLLTTTILFFIIRLSAQEIQEQAFKLTNSFYDEQNPVISPDGETLYFTIGNHPDNIGGKKDPGDIWFSRWMGDQWSAPVHAGSVINNRSYNAVAGISADGTRMYLHGHYDSSGTAKTQGISLSVNNGQGWSRPSNINIPYFLNKSAMHTGGVSADGRIFVFSAETYGSYGVEDIYVSFNEKGKWTEPKNLGPVINTQFQEVSPFVSSDGKTLYFSSNGLKGNGSFDIFSSTRLDDTWTKWSSPKNLGSINSSGRDLYYRIFPQQGYALYTSTINSDGYGDIKFYQDIPIHSDTTTIVQLPDTTDADTSIRITEVRYDSAVANPNLLRVHGKVLNSKTGEPVTAQIAFASQGKANLNTMSDHDGYVTSVPSAGEYTIFIEAQGYISLMEKLNIRTYEMHQLEMNFSLQPVEVGTTVNLKNVLFAQTKADILPESYPELDLVVNFLKANPNVRIELSGHTDNRGVHADNVKLSQQRVNKVKEYLTSKGIDGKRISGRGYGGVKPIASNDTEESRRMNRRVEFTIRKF